MAETPAQLEALPVELLALIVRQGLLTLRDVAALACTCTALTARAPRLREAAAFRLVRTVQPPLVAPLYPPAERKDGWMVTALLPVWSKRGNFVVWLGDRDDNMILSTVMPQLEPLLQVRCC